MGSKPATTVGAEHNGKRNCGSCELLVIAEILEYCELFQHAVVSKFYVVPPQPSPLLDFV
jgi:hypothetical protein